jgi:1-acyl-sn-glycerol-3-phosphate acyltransferase
LPVAPRGAPPIDFRCDLNIRLAARVVRVVLHLLSGMFVCGVVFPWVGAGRRNALIARWSRQLLAMCGVRAVQGAGAAPLPHAMIVANHVSWLDIFVINALQPCRFVAKSEIRAWPLVGWLVAKAGTVFIARGSRRDLRHIFKGLVESLHLGERVAFFPEGTTAQQGQLLPFHANLFEAAIDAKVPVQPYALRYLDSAGRHHGSIDYIGETTFVQSMLMVLSGPAVHAQLVCLAPMEVAGAHRRELARACENAIATALQGASATT